jgi:ubiquitin carboxyl-terminal hydrolase 36/42
MPAILKENITKLNENLTQSFKKNEKENYENHPTPTVKQVLSAKIEYEEIPNYTNTLSSLQTKYIILKPNQQPLNVQHANSKPQLTSNEKNINGSSTSLSSSSSSTTSKLPQPKRILFPKDKIQIGWNHGGNSRNWSSGCGFNNIGNTCYLNSALQAFFHVPALAQWLISDREHREKSPCKDNQPCIICAMSNTLLSTQRPNINSFTPSNITNRLSHICKHLTLGRQEDAHEFLRYLIEKMEKAYLLRFRNEPFFKDIDQYSKETTPLNQILGGYLRSTVTCFSCHHESVTFQHFQDLPLDISRVGTLTEAIQGYFSKENLEECGYKCESCKKRVSASKRFSLERAPAVLCIQLKRFTAMGGKLSKNITISEKLNLQKYLSKSSDLNQNSLYRFVSMVTHLGGSSSGGHYTAVGMGPNGNFYHFDDSRVSSIPIDSALRGNAYVLFYELVQSTTKSYESSMHNGHSIFHENGHTYVKNGLEINTNGTSKSNGNNHYEKVRENDSSFSKPNLPKLIPSHLIKHSHQLQQQNRQKESEQSSSSSKNDSNNKNFNSWNGNSKNSVHNGNGKRDESELEQDQKNDIGIKRLKIERSPLPSVPRLSENDDLKSPTKQSVPSTSNNIPSPPTTPSKPKSLVPYDDDEEEEPPTICRTTSGIFIETNIKDTKIKAPSKQGSTISTKASISKTTELQQKAEQQQNSNNNNNIVARVDDAISQLKKLNHSGYGTSNVLSWGNKPTNMNKEVVRDQTDERKRHMVDEDEDEMDRGRVKKIKYNNHSPMKGKLPNPFNDHQNMNNNGYGGNQNGHDRYNDRPVHNNFQRRHSFHHSNNNNSSQNNNGYNSGKNFNNNRNFHKDYKYNNNHNNNNNNRFSRNNNQFNYRR